MRAQSARYGYLVYVFHGDAERMKRKPEKKWDLYGLWTHSSCPVVQYICEESDRSAERLGLELLGQCVPQSNRQIQNRSNHGRWLVVQNDGVKLDAQLGQGNGLAPLRCSIKELSMESPFSNLISRRPRGYRERSPERRPTVVAPERRHAPADRPSERQSENPVNNPPLQWYTTSRGEEILRNIHNTCISNFPAPNLVEMSRDAVDHNIQLSIKHNDKTFKIHFPNNFPQSSAHVLYGNGIYSDMKIPDQAKSKEDIVRIIKTYCACYKCKYRR